MLEKTIEDKVCKYAKSKGFLVYKFQSPSNRGVPDRIFINPRGRVSFIEFKRKGLKATELQQHTIDAIREKGIDALVVDNVEDGKKVIDYLTGWARGVTLKPINEINRENDKIT